MTLGNIRKFLNDGLSGTKGRTGIANQEFNLTGLMPKMR
jgi:hypothetical protein